MGLTVISTQSEIIKLSLQLTDKAANKFPQVEIWDEANTLLTTLDLTHVDQGLYRVDWTVPTADKFLARFFVYEDAAHTVPAPYDPDLDLVVADLAPLQPEGVRGFSINPARLP